MIKQLHTKFITFLIVSVLLLFNNRNAEASHAMGADLTYTCLGGNTYKLRLSFYRDCIGINAPSSVYINISSASCSQNLGVTCNPIPGTGIEVTPICPSANSTCNGGNFTGIQEWIYEGVVTLPMQCTDWVFSYDLCCRNAAITTITNPGTSTFHIYATLNNTISPCNTSPTFSNKPVPFVCMGQQFCFNHGAFDADGDSLVYSLITPKQTASTTVNYINPYSATNPLNSVPAIQFNTQTGDICMTPQQLQVTVMAVLVSEYRNGILIGTVERDIQITVISCTNNLPTLSGINGTNNFSATICANQPFCFNIFSNDVDAGQNVFVSWDGGIPGATFSTNSAQHPTGTFCWTPTDNEIGGTYCFTAMVHDDACPYIGTQIYSYCINVIGITANAGPDQFIACNDIATLYASASGGSGTYTYQWSTGATTVGITVGPGTYVLTASDGQCTDTDTVQVVNAFMPTAAFNAIVGCVNAPVQFIDQSTLPGGTIVSWNWNFGDGGTSTLQNPVHLYLNPGTYNVQLIIETSFGCIDTVVQPVTINPLPVAGFTFPNGCAGTSITLTNTTNPSGINYNWNFGNGQTSNGTNPSVVYTDSGTYTITLIATDGSGCSDTISHTITIYPLPVAAFTFTGSGTCQNSTITFNNTSTGGISFNWNFGNGQTSNQQNPVITYNTPGNYDVTLTVTSANGCTASITHTITVFPLPVANISPPQSVCLGGNVTLIASGGITYQWSNGATTDVIIVSPTTATNYTVTVTDANGCSSTANVLVNVNPLPVAVVSPDQSICAGQSVTLSASGGNTFLWNPTGDTTSTITVSPSNSTTYAVNVTNANGCTGTGFINVTVHQLPIVNLNNAFICAGANTVLDAGNPGSTFNWSPGGQTTQTITVSSAGIYTVTVTNAFGCTSSASSNISQGGTIINNLNNAAFCAGGSAVLDAGNPGNTFLWSNGQTSQTITVTAGGTYSVTITDANGCSGTVATTVNVYPLPQPDFTPNDVCISDTMFFTDISTVNGGTIVAWQWDFGDGNVSQQQNPYHVYATPGTYSVTFTVTSNNGCVNSIIKSFNVFPLPTANFNYNNACVNSLVNLVNTSSTSVGNIVNWNWNFGDGSNGTGQNTSHAFVSPGTYPITLVITTNGGCHDTITKPVTVFPLPDAGFTAGAVCLNNATAFSNTSSVPGGVMQSWLWNFGDASTATAQNPVHLYQSAGTFNVSLIVTSTNGCSDTIVQPVTVFPLPLANAGPDQSVCLGDSIQLTASGGTSYLWTYNSATTPSIIVNPAISTDYGVTVTDANGCSATDSVRVTIKTLPVANAGSDAAICYGSSVTLTATGGTSYVWMPGGATTPSISVNPVVSQNYIVTVTGANGCSSNDTVQVTVNPLPAANAGPDVSICSGSTATLTANGGVSYFWSTGSNNQTIYVNPNLNSTYMVTVTDANGCINRDTINVMVNPSPVVNLQPIFICLGNTTVFDAGNPGSSYLWTPNGETTQAITISTAGTYGVLVTAANGCQANGVATVTVGGTGITGNLGNAFFCQGGSSVLDAGNPGSSYQWSTGATTQTISVNSAGTYTVIITDPTGCSSAFAANVTVHPLPVPSFTVTPTCLNAISIFTDGSTIASGNIITWNWNLGDGTISTLQNPVHQYSAPGTYNVTLQLTSGNGCTSSASQQVTISPKPTADFGSTIACFGSPSTFTDLSSITSGSINSWIWNFGDGNTSTIQNPQHIYNSAGTYNVTLIAVSGNSCADTIAQSVTVNPMPVPAFTANDACVGTAVTFTNQSFINNGLIDNVTWDFGDGTFSSADNPVHVYASDGNYQVLLTVTSDLGCSDTISHEVRIHPMPQALFTAPPACLNTSTVFTDQTTIHSGNISDWYWEFGDGISINQHNPTHTYLTPGTYNALLVATSNHGCSDSAAQSVVVYDVPVAAFNSTNSCLGSVTQFTDLSTPSSGGALVGWFWDFGNGTTGNTQNPSVNFATPGTYPVTLIVTDANGCSAFLLQSINVFPVPQALFNTSNVCLGTSTAFYNQSTVNGGGVMNCNWNFGDGDTSTLQNPVHTYTAPGTYAVTLHVTTAAGCSGTTVLPVTVFELPQANFINSDVCMNTPEIFTDLSVAPPGSAISSWNWNFGNGVTSANQNPIYSYPSSGTYLVTLSVTSTDGCAHTFSDSVRVNETPLAAIVTAAGCISDPVRFYNSFDSTNVAGNAILWNFGDGITSNLASPQHQYQQAGQFLVTLEVTNSFGCRTMVQTPIIVNPQPDAGFNVSNGCAGTAIQFTNTSTISSGAITGYLWNFGDSTTSTLQNPSHIFSAPGTYTITLIAISDLGCSDTASAQITIYPLPSPQFTAMNVAGCGPLPVQFTDQSFISSGSIVAWSWNFGDGGTDTLQNPIHIYQASGTYTVALTVTSSNGCQQTYSITNMVTVYPKPDAQFEPEPATTTTLNPTFQFNNHSTGANTYYWNFGDGHVSTAQNPSHTYADSGVFVVLLLVQNQFGCEDTITHLVQIVPVTTIYIPNAFTPNADGNNDVFTVKGYNILNVKLSIWNRWGENIFVSDDAIQKPWDGFIARTGDAAVQDVYIYQTVIEDVNHEIHKKTGRVTLIR